MNQKQREEITLYLEDNPSFYDFSSDRILEWSKDYNFLEKYLKPQIEEGMKVLDIGCGHGKTLSAISDTIKKGYGVEIDDKRYKMAINENKDNPNIEIIKGDVSDVPVDEKFDIVFTERGPAAAIIDNVREWVTEGGLFLVERIGEQHHRVFKEIMGRGQGYGKWDEKSAATKDRKILEDSGFEMLFMHNYFMFAYYENIVDLVKNVFAVPTIEYKGEEDLEKLKEVEKRLGTKKGIKLLNHYLVYVAKKI